MIRTARTTVRKGQRLLILTAKDRGLSGIGGIQLTNDKHHPPTHYANAKLRAQKIEIKLNANPHHKSTATTTLNPRKPIYVRLRDRAGNTTPWKHTTH